MAETSSPDMKRDFMLVHVDDITFLGTSSEDLKSTVDALSRLREVKHCDSFERLFGAKLEWRRHHNGILQSLTLSRHLYVSAVIQRAVLILARFQTAPTPPHLRAAKHIMRYLIGTKLHDTNYSGELDIRAFVGSDYVGHVMNRKSMTGFLI